MIKEIVKDNFFLSQVAEKATKEDLYIGTDLKDTLQAHLHECVGMAGNMIGYNKAVIIFLEEDKMHVMYNPEIIKTSGNYYECEEGCLSHTGQKPVKRYETIKVSYFDESFKKKIKTYSGFTAQIIQHECDHLKGILIQLGQMFFYAMKKVSLRIPLTMNCECTCRIHYCKNHNTYICEDGKPHIRDTKCT